MDALASHRATLSTVGIWLLLRVERLQRRGSKGPGEVCEEKPRWLTVGALAVKTGPPGRIGVEPEKEGGAKECLLLPPMRLHHLTVKCI